MGSESEGQSGGGGGGVASGQEHPAPVCAIVKPEPRTPVTPVTPVAPVAPASTSTPSEPEDAPEPGVSTSTPTNAQAAAAAAAQMAGDMADTSKTDSPSKKKGVPLYFGLILVSQFSTEVKDGKDHNRAHISKAFSSKPAKLEEALSKCKGHICNKQNKENSSEMKLYVMEWHVVLIIILKLWIVYFTGIYSVAYDIDLIFAY